MKRFVERHENVSSIACVDGFLQILTHLRVKSYGGFWVAKKKNFDPNGPDKKPGTKAKVARLRTLGSKADRREDRRIRDVILDANKK